MSWVSENIFDNPMMAEVGRFSSTLKGKGNNAIGLRAVIGVAILVSGLAILLIANGRGYIPPSVPLSGQVFVCGLAIAFRFYGVIAGERERASWDLLRVAPVTDTQVILGKFAGMLILILLVHAVFLLPLLMSMAKGESPGSGMGWTPQEASASSVLIGEVYSLVVCIFMAVLTLFFSARSKRSFGALGLTIGAFAVLFVFLPLFVGMAMKNANIWYVFCPFSALSFWGSKEMYGNTISGPNMHSIDRQCLISLAMYSALCIVMLVYAAKTLSYVDNNRIGLSKRKKRHA